MEEYTTRRKHLLDVISVIAEVICAAKSAIDLIAYAITIFRQQKSNHPDEG